MREARPCCLEIQFVDASGAAADRGAFALSWHNAEAETG